MRISDWSADVCSSDLRARARRVPSNADRPVARPMRRRWARWRRRRTGRRGADRKSVVYGKSVSVRVDLGGRRIIKIKDEVKLNTPTNLKLTDSITNTASFRDSTLHTNKITKT